MDDSIEPRIIDTDIEYLIPLETFRLHSVVLDHFIVGFVKHRVG